jgi:phosphoesterase RecJ-like protein
LKIAQIKAAIINNKKEILILGHEYPDLDCLGAALALRNQLVKHHNKVTVFFNDKIPIRFNFMQGLAQISNKIGDVRKYGLVFVLDTANKQRISGYKQIKNVLENSVVINIDHHVDNMRFGQINIIKAQASSVGEILFDLFEKLKWALDVEEAAYLYTAICFDTGRFLYSNVQAKTFGVVAKLMAKGIDAYGINKHMYETLSRRALETLKVALDSMQVNTQLKYAYVRMPKKYDADEIKVIDFVRKLEGTEVVLVFSELKNKVIKINFRSKGKFNVNTLAAKYGGGGHKAAAGAKIAGDLDEVIKQVVFDLEAALKQNKG